MSNHTAPSHVHKQHTSPPTATVDLLAAIELGANWVCNVKTFWLDLIASTLFVSATKTVESSAIAMDLGWEVVGTAFELVVRDRQKVTTGGLTK